VRVSGVAANISDGFIDVAIGDRQVQSAIKIHVEEHAPKSRVFLDAAPMPDAMDTSSKTPGAVARYRPIISLSKLVMATPGLALKRNACRMACHRNRASRLTRRPSPTSTTK